MIPQELFMLGTPRTHNHTPKLIGKDLAESKGLTLYQIGDSRIYARNEKEGIKRAKKRGLWRNGITIKALRDE